MKLFTAAALAASAVVMTPAFAATTIVNVNGVSNASLAGGNAIVQGLGAGSYTLSFIGKVGGGTFDAFNRFSSSTGCDVNGKHCFTGFENSVRFSVNGGAVQLFGDRSASGGLGTSPFPDNAYFLDAATSLANAVNYTTSFTLAVPGSVAFYIYDGDDQLADNIGGVSLAISAAPEPAAWTMMILGFGAAGVMLRRRRRSVLVAA